jgi:hypothetical protein
MMMIEMMLMLMLMMIMSECHGVDVVDDNE